MSGVSTRLIEDYTGVELAERELADVTSMLMTLRAAHAAERQAERATGRVVGGPEQAAARRARADTATALNRRKELLQEVIIPQQKEYYNSIYSAVARGNASQYPPGDLFIATRDAPNEREYELFVEALLAQGVTISEAVQESLAPEQQERLASLTSAHAAAANAASVAQHDPAIPEAEKQRLRKAKLAAWEALLAARYEYGLIRRFAHLAHSDVAETVSPAVEENDGDFTPSESTLSVEAAMAKVEDAKNAWRQFKATKPMLPSDPKEAAAWRAEKMALHMAFRDAERQLAYSRRAVDHFKERQARFGRPGIVDRLTFIKRYCKQRKCSRDYASRKYDTIMAFLRK